MATPTYYEVLAAVGGQVLNLPFPKLAEEDVTVLADGVIQSTSLYMWTGDQQITLGAQWPVNVSTKVVRSTDVDIDAFGEQPLAGYFDSKIANKNQERTAMALQEARSVLGALDADGDWDAAPAIVHGKRGTMMKDKNGNIVEGAGPFISAYEWGARPGSGDNTAFFEDALGEIRAGGLGGKLHVGPGQWLSDTQHYDWLAGGYGKFILEGAGYATKIKHRLDDDQPVFIFGRNSVTNTYQGHVGIKDIYFEGVPSGGEPVLDLWSLTTFHLENVASRYGDIAVRIRNCVTGSLINVQGSDARRGLDFGMFTFPDTTFSAANLISIYGGTFKDNEEWGIVHSGGSMCNMYGTQIENNGVALGATGGIYAAASTGLIGTNIPATGFNCHGVWFEANKGVAAVAFDGGAHSFHGCLWIANADATRDLLANGGNYDIHGGSMVNAKSGGNIEDGSGVKAGNTVFGLRIGSDAGFNLAKTTLVEVKVGNVTTPTRKTLRKSQADIRAPGTTEQQFQRGRKTVANDETVTFPIAFATGTVPDVICQAIVDAPARTYSVKVKGNPTNTGFTVQVTYDAGGSAASVNDSVAISWFAMGDKA